MDKIIHYCWFGGNPLPKDALKCIESWRKYMPDYEIREWNEGNFDINVCKYVSEAYAQKKYAFVSDYARFWVLYNYGGLYFDTDVELIKPLDRLVERGPFMGIEKSLATNGINPQGEIGVAPGLGIMAMPGLPLFKEIIDYYDSKPSFDITEGTVVYHTTQLLKKYGLKNENTEQHVAGLTIYPDDYLCPMDSTTGIITKTGNTVAIHHYSCSWMDRGSLSFQLHLMKNKLIGIFGPKVIMRMTRAFKGKREKGGSAQVTGVRK